MINMKARKVYEFKRTRKQGLSKQTEIGIVSYTKREIEKWFNKYYSYFIEGNEYDIQDDLTVIINILFEGAYEIEEIPFNLILKKGMDFSGTKLKTLPDSIISYNFLDFTNTQITELPRNLKIIDNGDLYLGNTQITKLPNNLTIPGNLNLANSQIEELPEDLVFNGFLDLENCKKITKLPNNLTEINGYLDLSDTNITKLPEKLTYINGTLSLFGTKNLLKLPDNLKIMGNLTLTNSELIELPKNLYVDGFIYVTYNVFNRIQGEYPKEKFKIV